MLVNLLDNAVKFTGTGGTVTLRVMIGDSLLAPEKNLRESGIRFEVEDTGVGISPEQMENIFQPFRQVGDSLCRPEGTGLGLTISRQLVELMGGRLRVTSEPAKGSLFYFEAVFPLAEMPGSEECFAQQEIAGHTGEPRKILVMDDNAENRLVLLSMLELPGFDVTLAENGKQGVEKAEKILPDCILMDLVLPVMSGLEAVKAIRQIPELRDTPIIAISASVFEVDRARSEIAGCDDFLPKPVDAGRLFSLIGKHLSLTWTYRESPAGQETPAPEPEIIPPPRHELEMLYELTRFGNLAYVKEKARKLEKTDGRYAPFVRKLCGHAKAFEDEPILKLLERFMGPQPEFSEAMKPSEMNDERHAVLIVDDNQMNVGALDSTLTSHGFEAITARNGAMGIRRAEFSGPGLILLDVMMPGMDGFETCSRLKADDRTKEIPVIFMTALSDLESKISAFKLGGVDYITKPFHEDEVLARVETHLTIHHLRKELTEQNRCLEERVREELEKRRKQERVIIQKSKIESMGRLAGGIAHEINQPLASLTMGIENILLKMRNRRIDDAYLEKGCGLLLGDTDRIRQIVDHIRIFSREQESAFFENVNVNEVVGNALRIIGAQYENHRVGITLELTDDIGLTLGNPYRLEQVLLNLLSNAKDALEENTDILGGSPEQRRIIIRTCETGENVSVSVEDNGKGIPEQDMEKIFEPFFTTKPPGKGTGLGLSIGHGIVREMNGDISVETEVGEYTKITISLPKIRRRDGR